MGYRSHGEMGIRPNQWVTPVVVGLATLLLSACGSGGATTASPRAASGSTTTQGRPAATGTIASISGSSMAVQNPRTGQVTVDWAPSTTFTQTVSASAADLGVGECVQVLAATGSSPGPAASRTVVISRPGSNGCARASSIGGGAGRGFGGGAGGFGGGLGGGGSLPFTTAFGIVTAAGNGDLSVRGTTSSGSGTTTFSYGSTTNFTKVESTRASSAVTGLCVTAYGTTVSSATVAATSIALRPAGPSGCIGGFRGGSGFGGGATPTTGSPTVGA